MFNRFWHRVKSGHNFGSSITSSQFRFHLSARKWKNLGWKIVKNCMSGQAFSCVWDHRSIRNFKSGCQKFLVKNLPSSWRRFNSGSNPNGFYRLVILVRWTVSKVLLVLHWSLNDSGCLHNCQSWHRWHHCYFMVSHLTRWWYSLVVVVLLA